MDIQRIARDIASRVANTGILEKVEDYILDKLYKEPIPKKNEEGAKEPK